MLRMLRVLGIIIFAAIVAYSANNLMEMHQNGELAERYNSARKPNITMLVFSICAVVTLGCFELASLRRHYEYHGYDRGKRRREEGKKTEGLDSTTDIYAARPTVEPWHAQRSHSSHSKHHKRRSFAAGFCMGLLRLCCVLMPILYSVLFYLALKADSGAVARAWLIPVAFCALIVFSIITAVGLFGKKNWGLYLGYLLAVCNLMVFPFGTTLGLFFLLGLAGSSAELIVSEREKRRRAERRQSARKAQQALT